MSIGNGLSIWKSAIRNQPLLGGGSVAAPSNTVPPSITVPVSATVGETLTGNIGTWSGSITGYRYAWKRKMPGSPFTETAIPFFDGLATSFIPSNAATETMLFGVQAYGPGGNSAWAWSSPTATIARAYVDSEVATNALAIWSHTKGVVSGYAGSVVELVFNGVTRSFGLDSKGILDFYNPSSTVGVIAWWIANGGGDYNGLMPRVSQKYNQGPNNATGTNGRQIQATAASRPILNLNHIRWDGLCPLSYNGSNARASDTAGTTLATTEINTLTTCAPSKMPFDSSNCTILHICDSVSNISTNNLASPNQQVALVGTRGNAGTGSNDNATLGVGNTSYAGNIGLMVRQATGNLEVPATPLLIPATRTLVTMITTTSTGNTIDTKTPSGTNAVVNITVNGDLTNKNFSANTAVARTTNAGGGSGWMIGTNGDQKAGTGSAQGVYGSIAYPGSLVTGNTGSIVDKRAAAYTALMKTFGINESLVTTNIGVFGASSSGDYAGDAGGGFTSLMADLLGAKVRLTKCTMAGARNFENFYTYRTALAALKVPGLKNIAFIYVASSDIGGGGLTGQQTWDYQKQFVDALYAAGWDLVCVSTFVAPYYKTASVYDPVKAGYNVDYNALVVSSAEKVAHGHISVDPAAITQLQSPDLPLYADAQTHIRSSNGHPLMAAVCAAGLAPHIA